MSRPAASAKGYMADTSLLYDAGELVPNARKHLVRAREPRECGGVTLADLWPEPDWRSLVQAGQPRELVAKKFIGYQSIRKRPRPAGVRGFTLERWEDAYRVAVGLLRQIYENATDISELYKVSDRLRDALNLSKDECRPVSEQNMVYWAAGFGGERTLKAPGPGTLRLAAMGTWLAKLGWPESDAAWKTSILPVQLQKDHTWRIAQVEGDLYKFIDNTVYQDEASVLEATLKVATKKANESQGSTKLIPRRPRPTSDKERTGPDHRNGTDISPEDLMSAFGLRAIQFGNSVTVKDRQRWLNQTFDGLADLADVLSMKRRWLGLPLNGESLALAIGARGAGLSAASAHYEQGLRVINQTYRNGLGTLAHEFGHALDHRIGMRSGSDFFLSQHHEYFQYGRTFSSKDKEIVRCAKVIVDFMQDPHSLYLRQSNQIASVHRAGAYWAQTVEMFARSFEAYIQDSLHDMGRNNPALVYGTLSMDYTSGSAIACPYPVDVERELLGQMHADLVKAILAPE